MAGQTPLHPTFKGHVATTWDALLLFEACLQGHINHVPRRPHDRERQDLISSGNIFIYEEHASGIKRWTDGISWSPSRILGNFLIYRELDKPFPPGEKKRALKRKRGSQGVNKVNSRSNSSVINPGINPGNISTQDPERSLVGSLVDSYLFKDKGLVKKTISITFQGVPHHLVSYYSIEDVDNKSLVTPSESAFFQGVKPRAELIMSQNFRNPVDDMAMYTPDENGFMAPNTQSFYGMGGHVADYTSPHAHVADYGGAHVIMTQAMPASGIAVAPVPSYGPRISEYEFMQTQPGRDQFEAQADAQADAQAQVQTRLPLRHHQYQYHDQLQQQQQHEQLHHQQLHQQQLQHQQMQRQQMQQQQLQMQMQQQQFQQHQLQQAQPDEQQNQLPQPSPQQQNGDDYGWAYGPDSSGYYFAHGH
ncbi:Gti1/Pac2 family domain-containing protein [Trichoderma barbatum]